MWQMFWFFNQLAELNLIQIPKKPDVSSQWPLFLRLFYLKRCHTHWETSMCTPISSIWASPNFFFIFILDGPPLPHYATQYTLPPFFYHYLKWKYKKRENGNIWAKRNSQHQPSPFHISAMYSAVKSFSISYVLLPCTPEPDRVGHYRENHRTTENAYAVRVHFISRYFSLFARLCKSLI